MKNLGKYIAILIIILGISLPVQANALNVAVFPVDDLSLMHNSVNHEMTDFLSRQVELKGLNVVSQDAVNDFMKRNKIRHLGYLQTQEIMAARSELKADLIILGSICQRGNEPSSLGMTISLARTSDGRTIWTSNKGLSLIDEQRFLGINSPNSTEDLQPILAEKMFVDWPADLDMTAGLKMAGQQVAAVKETAYIQVDTVYFTPKYVRPGQEVKCTIRFKSAGASESDAKVFIKVGNRVHLASSEDGYYYKAAWVGSDEKIGNKLQVASNDPDSMILNGVWSGDVNDADYPVSLILDWPSGKREESYIGSYIVDSQAPELSLNLMGKKVGDLISFRNQLPISVKFKKNEPITKWEMIITDKDNEVILRNRGLKSVPDRLSWRGQTSKNQRAEAGIYNIHLKVWDRAGNIALASQKVNLLPGLPGIDLALTEKDSIISAKLASLDGVPVTSWRMELWSEDYKLLASHKGDSLPVEINLNELSNDLDNEKIECILFVRDNLGSKSKQKIENVLDKVVYEDKDDDSNSSSSHNLNDWIAEF